jgi:hypothetical protein
MENKNLEKIFQYYEDNNLSKIGGEDSEMIILNDEQACMLYGGMSDFICNSNCNLACDSNCDSNCNSNCGNDRNCNVIC